MSKRPFTEEDMEKINALYLETTEQSKVMKEILLCLKGDESLNIEGVIPAQKRFENIIENKLATKQEIRDIERRVETKISEMDKTLNQLNDWKQMISIYFGMMLSKKIWKFIGFVIAIIVIAILSVKYGFQTVWHHIKGLFI